MDDPKTIILDISSDDGGGRDDGDWISELLGEVDKKMDDSDEVLVVGEFIANPKQRVSKSFVKCVDNEEDGDDDDCVVLDGDPDKTLAIENDGGEDSDDLCIVGEKGQVACRDYPHARHLCVKFPFNSTPHERHCDQCHCYVCDLVAPCVHWGNGVSSIDHCHATEKDEFWKAQRKGSKTSYKAPPLVSELGLTCTNEVSSLPNNILIYDRELPASQPCPINSGTPNRVMPARTQESQCDLSNKFQPRWLSHHLRRQNVSHAGNQFVSQRVPFKRSGIVGGVLTTNRYGNDSSRNKYGRQFSRDHTPGSGWQDSRTRGNSMLNTYQGSNQANFGVAAHSVPNSPTWSPRRNELGNYVPSQPQISCQIHSGSVNSNSVVPHPTPVSRWQNLRVGGNPMLSTHQGSNQANYGGLPAHSVSNSPTWSPISNGLGNYTPLQSQISSQILSSNVDATPAAPHPQLSSQTCWGSNFANLMPTVPGVAPRQSWGSAFENLMPLQPQAASQLNVGRTSQNVVALDTLVISHGNVNHSSEGPAPAQAVVSFQPNTNPAVESPSSYQPQLFGPLPVPNDVQNGFNPMHLSSDDVNFNQDTPTSQDSQSLPVESTQLHSAILREKPAQLPASSNPHPVDFQFNTWSLEDKYASEALDIPMSPGCNLFSPEYAPMDGGLLYDF